MHDSIKQLTYNQNFPQNKPSRSGTKPPLFFIKLALRITPRLLTNHIRVLPNFLIIGAAKCGTSSLYHYLTRHPCVAPAFRKEVYFFDRTFRRGMAWYRSFFPTLLEKYYAKKIYKKDLLTGESTPCYFFHPHAPQRTFRSIPEVKLIVLLRNPVDRAYSFYHMQFRRGIETLSFEQAIEREEERLQGELEKMLQDEYYFSFNRQNYSYLSRGIYVDQLKNWMRFFSKEKILILISEHMYTEPSKSFRQVLDFLNLPNWEPEEYKVFNSAPSLYPQMDLTTRKHLIHYFRPYNQQLYEFLGMHIDWDK